jgi:hypothetical protein
MIHFSCNFVLYFVLNVHFRRALKAIFCSCRCASSKVISKSNDPLELHRMCNATKSTVSSNAVL